MAAQVEITLVINWVFTPEIEIVDVILDGRFIQASGIDDFSQSVGSGGRTAQHFRHPAFEMTICLYVGKFEDHRHDIVVLDQFFAPSRRYAAAAKHEGDLAPLPGQHFFVLR